MGNDAEYDALLHERDDVSAQCSAAERKKAVCEENIQRLKMAKIAMTDVKSSFDIVRYQDKAIIDGKIDWKGNCYDEFQSRGDEMLTQDLRYYNASLDYVLDSLNNEITRLENELYEQNGFIGWCRARLNSLANSIENFFN